MRTFSDSENKLTPEQIQHLGLAGSIKSANDAGFIDFNQNKNKSFKNLYLDLENIDVLKATNPRTVVRDTAPAEYGFNTNATWRSAIEAQYYYSTYNIVEYPIGNISFTDLSLQKYSHADNDFFIPFIAKKSGKVSRSNKFKFSRFRFKKNTSNTNELKIQTPNGQIQIRPAENNLAANTKKYYYTWYHNLTTISSGALASQGITGNFAAQSAGVSGILSGYYIPYPTTLDKQDYIPYNISTQVAPKFNSQNQQSINGLLAISIGSANKKEIVYVSPHGLQTGFSNTYENFNLTESKIVNLMPGAKRQYVTLSGAGFNNANGIYREVKNYPSSGGLPRYRNISRSSGPQLQLQATAAKEWTGTSNPSIPRKEIYWDNYNWNIAVNNIIYYKSVSEISLRTTSRPWIDSVGVYEMLGNFQEIPDSQNDLSRVWEKNISSGTNNLFTKSILFWDPTQNLRSLNVAGGWPPVTGLFISVTPNYYNQATYTGNNMSALNSQYSANGTLFQAGNYKYFYKVADSRGSRRGRITPKFFDGWHLPELSQSGTQATFLNSWVLPYISGKTVLATGNFITQGNYIVTGATFWSGSGFQYVTGEFYGPTGNLFSGQVISGEGVSYYNITGYRTYSTYESGIMTGRPTYINPSNWTSGRRMVPLFSGANGVSTVSGNGSQLIFSGQTYWYPQTYLWITKNSPGIAFNDSGVQVVNGVVYLNNIPYSGYQTGFIEKINTTPFITTVCDSGRYQKYSNYIYTDGSGNHLLYDSLGDYGFNQQWIMINETNSYVSGSSGYNILFINKRKESLAANNYTLPRICWWDGIGAFANSGIQINNTPTPITGGYRIVRIPKIPSGFANNINDRKFLNLLSSDRGPFIYEFGQNSSTIFGNTSLMYMPEQNILNPSQSIVPNSGSFPIKLSATGFVDSNSANRWMQSTPWGSRMPLSIKSTTMASSIFNAKFNALPFGNSTYAPVPSVTNGAFYIKTRNFSKNKLIQLKSVYLDSKYINNGHVLPTGYDAEPYDGIIWNYPLYVKFEDGQAYGDGDGINTNMSLISGASEVYGPIESGIIVGEQYIPMDLATGTYKLEVAANTKLYRGKVIDPIKQDIPLKDTLFYKFYNHIYNGNKTLATGTWDGTIPSGSYFTVELISTYFDDNFGINGGNLGVFYSGDDSQLKSNIEYAYNIQQITGAYSKVDVRDNNLSYVSHAVNKNAHKSRMHAKFLARKKMQTIYNKTAKINALEILFKNSKYNKMQGFLMNKVINLVAGQTGTPFNTF